MTPVSIIWQQAAQLAREKAVQYGPMPKHALLELAKVLDQKADERRDDDRA